ncbi:unnamed protein product [Protopolystoma xenopodis]|uniref:Uncharacterized protein n=1 Tax=Protopolystoma xenopodis TaxID=117903 RepID=A0A448XPY2_9PLAT|nr:unnamed protein product [Protopolystoma xenopodis]
MSAGQRCWAALASFMAAAMSSFSLSPYSDSVAIPNTSLLCSCSTTLADISAAWMVLLFFTLARMTR